MLKSSRNARRIIKARRNETIAHRQGLHTLKSHALRAGLADGIAGGVAGALRGKAKTLGVTGTPAVMVRKTDAGVCYVRNARRYTAAQFRQIAEAYNPRAGKYVAARATLLAA